LFTKLRRLVVASAIVVPALAGTVALSAGTATAAPAAHLSTGKATAVAATAPTVNIKGSTAVYRPHRVTGAIVTGTCSSTNYSFLILNGTHKTQQVTLNGAAFGSPIPKGGGLYVCGTGEIKATFSLASNTAAVLNATIT
jgi:hypothetical protein